MQFIQSWKKLNDKTSDCLFQFDLIKERPSCEFLLTLVNQTGSTEYYVFPSCMLTVCVREGKESIQDV